MIHMGSTPDSGEPSLLVVLGVASIPAVAAIVAAIIAARSASKAKRAELEADRLRRLEERVAEQKYSVYKPMLELIRDMLDKTRKGQVTPKETMRKIGDFATWVTIFGSDEAVLAFRNFMQASFHDAPTRVAIRLYSDFVLAARRDMGDPNTKLHGADALALRINDLYEKGFHVDDALPLEEVFRKYGWTAPWLKATDQ